MTSVLLALNWLVRIGFSSYLSTSVLLDVSGVKSYLVIIFTFVEPGLDLLLCKKEEFFLL
jgi:hypothetical protein